jgi:hypothetical protein
VHERIVNVNGLTLRDDLTIPVPVAGQNPRRRLCAHVQVEERLDSRNVLRTLETNEYFDSAIKVAVHEVA